MHILLTNDDSHRSPLLELVIQACERLVSSSSSGSLTIVVPKHEQSWRGKSLTRFENVHSEEISLFGRSAYTVSGTPADCASVGIYHLAPKRPDLVVSGINAGLNTGSAFILCSGTVGACFEANIAGIPAVAFSQQFSDDARNEYAMEYALPQHLITHYRNQWEKVSSTVFSSSYFAETLKSPITLNVNLPHQLKPEWRLVKSRPATLTYGSFFRQESPGVYSHDLTEVHHDKGRDDNDSYVIDRGDVSVSLLDLQTFGQPR